MPDNRRTDSHTTTVCSTAPYNKVTLSDHSSQTGGGGGDSEQFHPYT